MPRIVDMAEVLSTEELDELTSSAQYRAMLSRDAGEFRRRQRRFLRVVLEVKWRLRCAYCSVLIAQKHVIDVVREYHPRLDFRIASDDHIVPRRKGGSYTANNIVPACHDCNTRRGHMPIDQFLTDLGWDQVSISEWHRARLFDSQTARTIDECLVEIEGGRRFSVNDVPWIQALGDTDAAPASTGQITSDDDRHELRNRHAC